MVRSWCVVLSWCMKSYQVRTPMDLPRRGQNGLRIQSREPRCHGRCRVSETALAISCGSGGRPPLEWATISLVAPRAQPKPHPPHSCHPLHLRRWHGEHAPAPDGPRPNAHHFRAAVGELPVRGGGLAGFELLRHEARELVHGRAAPGYETHLGDVATWVQIRPGLELTLQPHRNENARDELVPGVPVRCDAERAA